MPRNLKRREKHKPNCSEVIYYGTHQWLTTAVGCLLLLGASGGKMHHRRSMAAQQAIPISKGGWRPVIGSNSLLSFGSFGTAPLHASPYKLQPTYDLYQSSSRPVPVRDAPKLTSIAQSYRATTLRTAPSPSSPPINQPVSSYHNPFALNQGQSYYKFIQNFPTENFIIRNPHNPYAARPQKIQTKYKQPFSNAIMQQLTNVQPIQFGQYPTLKPTVTDYFGKPLDFFGQPIETKKPHSAETEIFKPEVYKVPSDTETAPQSVNQQIHTGQQIQQTPQVQTAQQQQQNSANLVPKPTLNPSNPFNQYPFQSSLFPSSLLGSYGLQPIVGKNPVYQMRPYIPAQPTRQTFFNSYSYTPTFKTTPTFFIPSSTPKLQTNANQVAAVANNFQTPTEPTKTTTPAKIDPNAGTKTFKPSPQDPFNKLYNKQVYAVSTYKPPIPSTANTNNFKDYNYQSNKPNILTESYYKQQQSSNNAYQEKYRNKLASSQQDSVAAGVSQQPSINHAPTLESTPISSNHHNTYEVTENNSDIITHASPQLWTESYDQKVTEEAVTSHENLDSVLSKPSTPLSDVPEEVAIVTEENSLTYEGDLESQSRRPLGDGTEPIEKHKLKDYYYRVSTPTYEKKIRRTKKPGESSTYSSRHESTTYSQGNRNNDSPADALPTLPPNKHFKRPSSTAAPELAQEKDKVRKRTKLRRRRPQLANINRNKNDSSAEANSRTSRPTVTAPTVTTEYTTSAIPTLPPTNPTIVKKKLVHRRPVITTTTAAERIETTTHIVSSSFEPIKESPIMKIASRQQYPKLTPTIYEIRTDIPDYTHKQDEKDTPTSDIILNLPDTLKTTAEVPQEFSFHRDARPVDQTTLRTTTEALSETTGDVTTTRAESSSDNSSKQRPRLKNKYNRPRFSVKDYRNRLSSTTSTTEKSVDVNAPKIKFPQRRLPYNDNGFNSDVETTTERKKFMPKDPRHRGSKPDNSESESVTQTTRHYSSRQRPTTEENTEVTTQKISSRIRAAHRRRPVEETTETASPTSLSKRPLRKKIKDADVGESVQDITVTETTQHHDRNDITSERTRSESAIMKIADKKHQDHQFEHLQEHSKRVSDLTLAASKDYNTPGMFKSVSTNSRRIPNYFTIATDDPILPIEAFFPQLNQKKES